MVRLINNITHKLKKNDHLIRSQPSVASNRSSLKLSISTGRLHETVTPVRWVFMTPVSSNSGAILLREDYGTV